MGTREDGSSAVLTENIASVSHPVQGPISDGT
jgi:hypothetical protein